MRRIASGGFALIGAISTVVWIVSLFGGQHHRPSWELLSIGLACFLASAVGEVVKLRRAVGREERRDRLLKVIERLTRECQTFAGMIPLEASFPSRDEYREWLAQGERDIARYSSALATEWAGTDRKELSASLYLAFPKRLERLHDLQRAVMAPGSHLGTGTLDNGERRLRFRFVAHRRVRV